MIMPLSERMSGKSKNEKILENYKKDNEKEIREKFNLSYSELMDIVISSIGDEEKRKIFVYIKNKIKELRKSSEEYNQMKRLEKEEKLKLKILKSYQKILSSKPEYIA